MKKKYYLCAGFQKYTIMSDKAKRIIYFTASVIIASLTALLAALGLNSCNVTRVVTNESSYLQRGDTSVVIHTKTIETYDATKKGI